MNGILAKKSFYVLEFHAMKSPITV